MRSLLKQVCVVGFMVMTLSHGSEMNEERENWYAHHNPLVPEGYTEFGSSRNLRLSKIDEEVIYLKDDIELEGNALVRYGIIHKPGIDFENVNWDLKKAEVSIVFYYMNPIDPCHDRESVLFHMVASFKVVYGKIVPYDRNYAPCETSVYNNQLINPISYYGFYKRTLHEMNRLFSTYSGFSKLKLLSDIFK